MPDGEEMLNVLTANSDQRAGFHAVYRQAHGREAPVTLSPATSTLVQVPAEVQDAVKSLIGILNAAPSPDIVPPGMGGPPPMARR
jgi:hypothetical protein